MMKQLWNSLRRGAGLGAVCFALLGLILVIWPGTSAALACRAVGAALLLYGGAQCIQMLCVQGRTFLGTAVLLVNLVIAVVGLWVLLFPEMVLSAIPVITGIILLVHGVQNVGEAMTLYSHGYSRWWAALLMGIVTLALGIVLILNPFTAVEVTFRVIGLFLICDGLSDLWIVRKLNE